jgi:glutathione synthase/RimK-type ligase-like ATP-grasp enzyme
VPEAAVLTARSHLAEPEGGDDGGLRVLNLCRTARYQGRGYYVSLLAEARGQRPLPDVKTVENLKAEAFVQALSAELQPLVQQTLHHDESDRFELDAYLGQDPAQRHPALAQQLFGRTQGRWQLQSLQAIGVADIPVQHRAFLLEALKAFAAEPSVGRPQRHGGGRPRLAILWDPAEPHKPSNDQALQRLLKAAPLVGLEAELVGPEALERLPEFDGLFNRASPEVDGVVYEFVRRAESLGMPVVDDPESILKCLNKAYMHELMSRHRIAQPRTLIVQRGNLDQVAPALGLPCVLKLPDSGFGLDVVKIESEDRLRQEAERFFKVSALIVAQEWLPTGFDWRVGVYDRRPLFVAKYFMVPGHWKVNQVAEGQRLIEGRTEAMAVGEAPEQVIQMALRAANLIGRGLYGADLKQVEDRVYLNPNLDAGNEGQVLGDALYREIVGVFARRIAERVLLVGLGPEPEFREGGYRAAVSAAARVLCSTGAADAAFCPHELPVPGRDAAWKIEQSVLAVMDSLHRFDQLKSKPPPASPALAKVVFPVADRAQAPAAEAAIARAAAIAEGVALARDLGNLPGNLCTPAYLAEQARALTGRHRFQVTVLEREEIEQLGMGAFLAIARGSPQPPELIVMEHRPATSSPRCRARPWRSSTPTPRAGWCCAMHSPMRSATRRRR